MVSITQALRQIKDDLAQLVSPESIEQVCREVGHTWRDRELDPVSLIHLFILQILHRNTACSHLPHLSGRSFTASAYCQARARLPLKVITTLVARIGLALQAATRTSGRWHSLRPVLVDGSGCSMPDTPALQAHFGQPGGQAPGCGFPVAHLLAALEAESGLILDLHVAPLRSHDLSQVPYLHPSLQAGDVLVADRGFCSFVHLALLRQRGVEACVRVHQKHIVSFRHHRRSAGEVRRGERRGRPTSRWVAALGKHDQQVEWVKPKQAPEWISAEAYEALPASLPLRELRYQVLTPGFRTRQITLVTTLLDPVAYPASELADLYRRRWEVETGFAHLKTTLGMDVLHCKSVEGVMKEMWMFVLVYNLVRMVMLEAARRQEVPVERISFIDALRWLAQAPADAELPALGVNPHRPNRLEPRVIKRRMKESPLMKRPRDTLRQALRRNRHAA